MEMATKSRIWTAGEEASSAGNVFSVSLKPNLEKTVMRTDPVRPLPSLKSGSGISIRSQVASEEDFVDRLSNQQTKGRVLPPPPPQSDLGPLALGSKEGRAREASWRGGAVGRAPPPPPERLLRPQDGFQVPANRHSDLTRYLKSRNERGLSASESTIK